MKQVQFEQAYASQWQQFTELLQQLEASGKERKKRQLPAKDYPATDYQEFARLYRRICHYHALARDRQYSSYLVDTLADLVSRGHQQLYQRKHHVVRNCIAFLAVSFPRLVRREWRALSVATALLYLPALLMGIAVGVQPELVFTMMDPEQVNQFESMYNPENAVLGSARDSQTNWHMFGFYINNNIGVAFRTFASGIFLAIGSVFFLVFNGLIFGAVAGHLTGIGYTDTFFSFVIGHGSFELTAITIAGAAGLRLGYALLAPGHLSRLASLKAGAGVAVQLMYGVTFMLVVAAFIEAFWSSSGLLAYWQKYLVGLVLWIVVFAYLLLGGRRRGSF